MAVNRLVDGEIRDINSINEKHASMRVVTPEDGKSDSRSNRASAVQSAIDDATSNNYKIVYVPDDYLNYDASAVTFDNDVRMIREGQQADVYDVKAYGAAGDGSTDDTSAIQAAIDAASSSGDSRKVYIPLGHFLFSTLDANNPVIIEGGGWSALSNAEFGNTQWEDNTRQRGSILESTATSGVALDFPSNVDTNHERFVLRDLFVLGPGSGTSKGVQQDGVSQARIDSVLIANFSVGYYVRNSFECQFTSLHIRGCEKGFWVSDSFNNNLIENLEIQQATDFYLKLGDPANVGSIRNNIFNLGLCQGNASLSTTDGIVLERGGENLFLGWWFETALGGSEIKLGTAEDNQVIVNVFRNLRMTNNRSGNVPTITVGANTSADTVRSNRFYDSRGLGPAEIVIDANAVHTWIEHMRGFNLTDNSPSTVHISEDKGSPWKLNSLLLQEASDGANPPGIEIDGQGNNFSLPFLHFNNMERPGGQEIIDIEDDQGTVVLRVQMTNDEVAFTSPDGSLVFKVNAVAGGINFFGDAAPVGQQSALTAADGSTVDATYGTEERDVIQNLRTRVNELETKLQAYGLLA